MGHHLYIHGLIGIQIPIEEFWTTESRVPDHYFCEHRDEFDDETVQFCPRCGRGRPAPVTYSVLSKRLPVPLTDRRGRPFTDADWESCGQSPGALVDEARLDIEGIELIWRQDPSGNDEALYIGRDFYYGGYDEADDADWTHDELEQIFHDVGLAVHPHFLGKIRLYLFGEWM